MAKTICFANQKGGVGKTTSTLNIGAALAGRGYRVLLVDCDQQASLTVSLGINPLELEKSMRALLVEAKTRADQIISRTDETGLDLIPASIDLAFAELHMPPLAREKVLADKLGPIKDSYDFILIDTSPSYGTLVVNALAASDYLLTPVQPEPLCIFGLNLLVENLQEVKSRVHPELKMLGFFVTLYDKSEAAHVQLTEKLKEDWGKLVFKQIVRDSSLNDRSVIESRPIVLSRPRSLLAQDYQALTDEVLNRVQ